ncbi:hypothetical protein, partial [Endozoicomonas sp. ONNA2]|uniref:hypothetical protein n=1 Tax=Endozoicomonas sp. ONNA2 TaxID=2828741 RepID=UPI0021492DD7
SPHKTEFLSSIFCHPRYGDAQSGAILGQPPGSDANSPDCQNGNFKGLERSVLTINDQEKHLS